MQRFSDDARTQIVGCSILRRVLCVPDGVMRFREVNGGSLVCAALRLHHADADVAAGSFSTLLEMLDHGLASSIDATATSVAEAARRAHPSDALVQKSAAELISRLLASHATPSIADVSPERAALDRVAELKARRDFASLVRDTDAFPECEELQRAGSLAIFDILSEGGSAKEAAAAGAIECVIRATDLFQHSAKTQSITLLALNRLVARTGLVAVQSIAGNAGAARLAVRALRTFPEDSFVISPAFYVLGNLASVQLFVRRRCASNPWCSAWLRFAGAQTTNDGVSVRLPQASQMMSRHSDAPAAAAAVHARQMGLCSFQCST